MLKAEGALGGAIATVDPIATDAAVQALKDGGNAIDAAVAAGLTLGVVNGYNSGIGGGCFVVCRLADGTVFTLNGREKAPGRAHRDLYLRNGEADPNLSRVGALAVAVPGALMAYAQLSETHGRIPFRKHLLKAAAIAEQGFKIPAAYASTLKGRSFDLKKFPASARIFLDAKGNPYQAGAVLKQTDLANTYRQVAAHGTDWFYKGPFAKKTAAWMNANDGVLSEADFAQYTITRPAPVQTTYRGYTVYGMPPPSSGGVHVIQILNMLETRNLKKINPQSADFFHLISESMKLAFADRAHWLGDPAFAKVPRGLMDKGYARKLAARIHPSQIIEVKSHGIPPKVTEDIFDKHTTHFSCADSAGNWVAITATINTHFGSKVVIPGTGVLMNNEMDDFAAAPGAPNAFGLLGAEANSVEPGKRPLSSMSPTLVLKGNQPVLAVGAAGGPTIITQTLLAMVHTLDYGLPLKEALAQPRFHHQWKPDTLRIELKAGQSVLNQLRQRGHQLKLYNSMGATQAVGWFEGKFKAVHDPRSKGKSVVLAPSD
ncbi:MAG: gamma-glutamyltransferase [Pedosphaera sp.]|nr:gamma-glutamyltransferase [Pedosphaera sp.]